MLQYKSPSANNRPLKARLHKKKTFKQFVFSVAAFFIVLVVMKSYFQLARRYVLLAYNNNKTANEYNITSGWDETCSDTDTDIELEKNYPFTIVTGASKNHFCQIKAWLYALNQAFDGLEPAIIPRIIIYDLGLSSDQQETFKVLHQLDMFNELRTFDFSAYPQFWNISVNHGEYGWKPACISEVAADYPGVVVWLDSGSHVNQEFFKTIVMSVKAREGFLSSTSQGNISRWTHPGMFAYFQQSASDYTELSNCNGAFLAFDTMQAQCLIDKWLSCAMIKDCIAPKGSNRTNHRQDQAALSLLAALDHRYCEKPDRAYGVKVHNDGKCKQIVEEYENQYPKTKLDTIYHLKRIYELNGSI